MSTFPGEIEEIPGISIDRFTDQNLESHCFFLSHCHIDHMVGINSGEFQEVLAKNDRFLYLSHVSAEILRRLHPILGSRLVELDLYGSTTIDVKGSGVAVTPIPAGHCPGSVMFLFQTKNKTILYTGDFRIKPSDLSKFKAFYDTFGQLKKIDKIWLDTTFFLKSYLKFPPRSESLKKICTIIKDWIGGTPKNVIQLKTPARYGYEYLFIEISNELKMPIHVNADAYNFYKFVPEMDEAITRNGDETQIHCACGIDFTEICRYTYNVKSIKISAWRWQNRELEKGISEENGRESFVCYSTHASYEEGAALLRLLKPNEVGISVFHKNDNIDKEIRSNIDEILNEYRIPIIKHEDNRPKLFKIGENSEKSPKKDVMTRPNFNNMLDSPPRKRRF